MGSRGERELFPVPVQGVRADVDELVAGPNMAVDSSNVVVYDDALRPRPACTREGFYQQASQWVDLTPNLTGSLTAGFWPVYWEEFNGDIVAFCRDDSDTTAWEVWASTDDGLTFAKDATVTGLPTGEYVFAVQKAGNNVYLFCSHGNLYVSACNNYPTTPLAFSLLGTFDVNEATNPFALDYTTDLYMLKPIYDENEDWLILSVRQFFDDVQAWGNEVIYFIPTFSTMAGVTEDTHYFDTGLLQLQPFEGGVNFYLAAGYIWQVNYGFSGGGPPDFVFVEWSTGFIFEPVLSGTWSFAQKGTLPIEYTNNGLRPQVLPSPITSTKALFIRDGKLEHVTIDDAQDPPALTYEQLLPEGVYNFGVPGTAKFGRDVDVYLVPSGEDTVISLDASVSWEEQPGVSRPNTYYEISRLFEITNSWFASYTDTLGVDARLSHLYLVPGGAIPAGYPEFSEDYGDVTSIYQADMDNEDKAILVGTTKQILKLDRSTNLWVEQTSGGDAGPPTYPDTRMGGAHGDNPVLFRTFEVEGKTYILSTNGESYPMIWHPDLPGGKARFMGQILDSVNDPRYNTGNTGDPNYSIDGDDAPVARCIAIAANRVLLLNLPGVSSGGVDVSDFNDPDRGFSKVQMTILGDTPGPIVSANEISALQVAVYKTDAIYHAVAQTEFLGVAAPFRFELVKAGISGPCSPLCVLNMHTGTHAYLATDGGIYVYDGAAPKDVGRNVRRLIQPYLDENTREKAWGMSDPHRKLLWFFFPTKSATGAPILNRGVVMATDQGFPWPVWPVKFPDGWQMAAGMRAFFLTDKALGEMGEVMTGYGDSTLGSFTSGREEMIMGRLNNTWYTQQWDDRTDYTDDGTLIDVLMQSGWHPLGSTIDLKTVHELYHVFRPEDDGLTLDVNLLARQLNQKIIDQGSRTLVQSDIDTRTQHRATGERFAVKLAGSISRMFRWGGATATFTRRGTR